MKTPIYVIVLIVLVLFSCSKDELDNGITFNTAEYKISDDESKALTSKPDIPQDEGVCFRAQLLDDKFTTIGYVDFAVIDTDVLITFKTDGNWNLQETYLDIIACTSQVFPLDSNGNPILNAFKYSSFHKEPVKRVDHVLDDSDVIESLCYAAYGIVVDQYGKSKEVWAHGWEIYTPAYLKSCLPDNADELEYCDDEGKKAYICHNGQTICVSVNAIDAHLAHGDKLGQCED